MGRRTISEITSRQDKKKYMTKWYNKPIEIITRRNYISVLLFINSFALYVFQKLNDNNDAKIISIFSFSLGIGQSIGERIGEKRKKNTLLLCLLAVVVISPVFKESVSMFILGISIGELMGYNIGRMRAKRQID